MARLHLQPTDRLSAAKHLNLAIGLPLRNTQALDDLLRQLYDPASPDFRHYLTPGQFTEKFGPTEKDYQTVIDFAKANGLTVTGTHPNRVILDVSGSVADIERAFHVVLRTYRHPREERDFFAPDVEPSVDLAVPIIQVSGLNNYSLPHSNIKIMPAGAAGGATPNSGSGPGGTYMGNDFRAAYVPGTSLTGSGQSVALLQFDGYISNDIAAYISKAGLTGYPISLTNVPVNGGVSVPGGDNSEVCLDIEMVLSMSPGVSKIIVYEAPNGSTSWSTILSRIANDNLAKQIGCSWSGGASDAAADGIFKQMASQGQSFFCASGDYDAFNGSIPFLLDDTNITLVGGTVLTTTGSGGSYVSEIVWNDRTANANGGNWGSSGGISPTYAIPDWQQGVSMTGNQGSTTMRNVPDVALTAKNCFIVADTNQPESASGTSCAAPLWAGFTALVNQQAAAAGNSSVGFINPAIYEIGRESIYGSSFHDITTGDNSWPGSSGKFYATNGYDLCTGWGTPTGTNLINALVNPDPIVIAPPGGFSSSGQHGGPFSFTTRTFSVTNSGTGSLNWFVTGLPSWLSASLGGGTLVSGGSNGVTIGLNTTASNLFGGIYTANVCFSNKTSQIGHYRLFTLQINDPLVILPTSSLPVSGPVGGPFNASSQNFLLTNSNMGSLSWSVAGIPPWLNVSPTSGTLSSYGSSIVTVGLNSTGSSVLAVAGSYVTNLTFTDLTSGAAETLQFTLLLGQSLVANGGFETGDFSSWTLVGDGGTYNYVDSGSYVTPHSGFYVADLGEAGFLAYLSQSLKTSPGQSYLLSFWLDAPSSTSPQMIVVNWNTNVVYTNNIGTNSFSWTNLQFIVTATGTNTTLQFGAQDDSYYLGLDDVAVTPIPNPAFRSVTRTGTNAVVFGWNSLSNIAYQVQYSTNLAKTNWTILGTNTATGSVLTFTNAYGSDRQRFYRIRRLP